MNDYDSVLETDMINQYKYLISSELKKRFSSYESNDKEDIYQCGLIGLLSAIRNFDPTKSDNFEGYARRCVYHEMLHEAQRIKENKCQSLDAMMERGFDVDDSIFQAECTCP